MSIRNILHRFTTRRSGPRTRLVYTSNAGLIPINQPDPLTYWRDLDRNTGRHWTTRASEVPL